jgi:3-hydroxybutyryl-CoA dehydratase
MAVQAGDAVSTTMAVTPERVKAFAEATGDWNPVHFDPAHAAGTVFKRTIGHGMLTVSSLVTILGMQLPGPGTVIGSLEVKFLAPVYVSEELTSTVRVREVQGHKMVLDLEARVGERVVLTGTAKASLPKAGA